MYHEQSSDNCFTESEMGNKGTTSVRITESEFLTSSYFMHKYMVN